MVEPHLEDVDIKSIKAEPEPSGSGSGAGGGATEVDLGDESYGAGGADGDDNGDFGAEGEFEGFDQYGDGSEFDDSMSMAGGSGAAADGKGRNNSLVFSSRSIVFANFFLFFSFDVMKNAQWS